MAITYKEIEKANSTLNTTSIKGREYAEVNQRIKAFRMIYPEGYIKTEIVELDTTNGVITMRATAGYYDENGEDHILGMGTAFEWKNDTKSMVNKTSYVENCETSAVGRALGMIGLGIDVSIASADEVNYAISHQEAGEEAPQIKKKSVTKAKPTTQPTLICDRCHKPITEGVNDEGKPVPASAVAKKSKELYGKQMCWDCAHKTKLEIQEKENMKVDEQYELPFPVEE